MLPSNATSRLLEPLRLRLSNGRDWAHEFTASSVDEFRAGCMEALLENGQRDPMLYVHVFDEVNKYGNPWRDAGYGSGGAAVFIRRPRGDSDQYNHPQWQQHWNMCVRCHFACQELRDFLDGVIGRINPDRDGAIDA